MTRGELVRMAVLCLVGFAPAPARADDPEAVLSSFFSIWDRDARVTLAEVRRQYAREVVYYGRPMTDEEVYRNKRDFVARWPERRYAVVPGSAARRCEAEETRCSVSVTLSWSTASPARHAAASGLSRVTLTLARQDGTMKIVGESGRPVERP